METCLLESPLFWRTSRDCCSFTYTSTGLLISETSAGRDLVS